MTGKEGRRRSGHSLASRSLARSLEVTCPGLSPPCYPFFRWDWSLSPGVQWNSLCGACRSMKCSFKRGLKLGADKQLARLVHLGIQYPQGVALESSGRSRKCGPQAAATGKEESKESLENSRSLSASRTEAGQRSAKRRLRSCTTGLAVRVQTVQGRGEGCQWRRHATCTGVPLRWRAHHCPVACCRSASLELMAWTAVMQTVLMMSSTVHPRERSLTGLARPCRSEESDAVRVVSGSGGSDAVRVSVFGPGTRNLALEGPELDQGVTSYIYYHGEKVIGLRKRTSKEQGPGS